MYRRLIFWLLALLVCEKCRAGELEQLLRRSRATLLYPDPRDSETKVQVLFGLGLPMEGQVSMTLGYVVKCNYNLPYNVSSYSTPVPRQLSRGSRWSLYRILESLLDKSCVLRAVCEAASQPLDSRQGLAARLVQLMLSPSASFDEFELYADREYLAAEAKGRRDDCSDFYRDCTYSPLDYFTRLVHSRR